MGFYSITIASNNYPIQQIQLSQSSENRQQIPAIKPRDYHDLQRYRDGDPTRDIFVVTNDTKEVAGITTRVVHDDGYVKSDHEETTNDWFAQDDSGNVWYMGEFTTDLSNKGSHEGSWEAGVKGAKAGIVMQVEPKVGDTYNQEFAKGIAEDKGTILGTNEKLCVLYGCFSNVTENQGLFSP